MARRKRSNRNNDADLILQLIAFIFIPIILLLRSKNPFLKWLGAVLLLLVFISITATSSGLSAEETATLVIGVFIVCIGLLVFWASRTDGSSSSNFANKSDNYTHTYAKNSSIKTATLKKGIESKTTTSLPKIKGVLSFDELFRSTEQEIESIIGPFSKPSPPVEGKTEDFTPRKDENINTLMPVSDKSILDNKGTSAVQSASVCEAEREIEKNSKEKCAEGQKLKHIIQEAKILNDTQVPKDSSAVISQEVTKTNGPVLPKIVIPEVQITNIKSEDKLPVTIDPSFMNPPIEDEIEDSKSVPLNTDTVKDEYYYDSVAEAVGIHHIPKEYQKIMIHQMENTDICECPALIWREQDYLKLLPLLRDARIFQWPLKYLTIIIGERRYNPDYDNEYMRISNAALGKEFQDQFPEYIYGRRGTYTDIFTLPIGVSVTNTSAKAIFSLINAEFTLEDEVIKSNQYVSAVKELYRKHFLYENHVLSLEEYNSLKADILEEYLESERSDSVYRAQIKYIQGLEL